MRKPEFYTQNIDLVLRGDEYRCDETGATAPELFSQLLTDLGATACSVRVDWIIDDTYTIDNITFRAWRFPVWQAVDQEYRQEIAVFAQKMRDAEFSRNN